MKPNALRIGFKEYEKIGAKFTVVGSNEGIITAETRMSQQSIETKMISGSLKSRAEMLVYELSHINLYINKPNIPALIDESIAYSFQFPPKRHRAVPNLPLTNTVKYSTHNLC